MWRSISASVTGPSHEKSDAPCQDSHLTRVLTKLGDESLVACVADGAGSAAKSHDGSALVCEAIVEQATEYFDTHDGSFATLSEEIVITWCQEARERIVRLADMRQERVREYATTLVVALMAPECAFFVQIGDGAIVARRNGALGVVFWPASGEYANSTNFLTAEDYEQHLECLAIDGEFAEVALFTDGIERLALSFEGYVPHLPFFDPLFNTLRSVPDPAELNPELSRFLNSESMKNRSDDDKTVVLAVKTAP